MKKASSVSLFAHGEVQTAKEYFDSAVVSIKKLIQAQSVHEQRALKCITAIGQMLGELQDFKKRIKSAKVDSLWDDFVQAVDLSPSAVSKYIKISKNPVLTDIGRACAVLFGMEGARVAALDLNIEAAEQTARDIGGHAIEVDVSNEESVAAAIESAATAMGGIDGVVNAAGIMITGPMREMPISSWRRTMDVNLTGTYLIVRNSLRWLEQSNCSTVVNIASAAGVLPNAPGLTAYAASKGAVINLTRALAAELAPTIRVNTVAPGMVDTPMAAPFRANVSNYALKRLANPEEIANAILFLTSEESSYVTGTLLAVDGGRSFH